MKKYKLSFLSIIFLVSFNASYAHISFQTEALEPYCWGVDEGRINYQIDGHEIGYIYYVHILNSRRYVIHSLYIYPQYRHKGHGTALLTYACEQLKKIGRTKIYIQPGPFERDGKLADSHEHEDKLHKLVRLYKKAGFSSANKFLSICAALAYRIIGIDENARYVMVKN